MKEIWKNIPRCDGYEASSLGRIKNNKTGKIFNGSVCCKGYVHVSVIEEGVRRNRNIARLVARAFIGDFDNIILHTNGNPADNRQENLRYGTAKDNYDDARKHGTYSHGKRHGNAILDEEKVREIRRLYRTGEHSYNSLAREYTVNKHTIKLVIKRKNWKHVEG
jgi:hypothetical protein